MPPACRRASATRSPSIPNSCANRPPSGTTTPRPRSSSASASPASRGRLAGIYDGIEAPLFEVAFEVAETVKFVDNSFHALKVAFANEIGRICLGQGVDPQAVADVFLADTKLNISHGLSAARRALWRLLPA